MAPRVHTSQAKEFEQSNATTKAFLGGKEKAWMTGHPLQTIAPSSTTKTLQSFLRNHDPENSLDSNLANEQGGPAGNNSTSSTPVEAGLDRGEFPAQRRRCGGTKSYLIQSSTSTVASPTSPALSPPILDDTPLPSSESTEKHTNEGQNLLPSPSPSVETRRQSANVLELDADTVESPPSGGPHTTRLANLLAKYGGFEELEKRLEDAERSSLGPSPVVVTQPQATLQAPTAATSTPEGRPPPSLPIQPQPAHPDVQRPSTTMPNKRALDNATEPRKRLQSLPDTSRQDSTLSHSELTATPAGTVYPRPPPDSHSEMQNFSQRVTLQLQHVQNQYHGKGLDVVRPRLELLHDACNHFDYFYLLLHQIYCLEYRLRRSDQDLGLNDSQKGGLNVVSYLLVSNEHLAPESLQWFCIFPLPLDVLLTQSQAFRKVHGGLMRCLEKMADGWDNLKKQCRLRRYPPLVDELCMLFEMTTFTLQKVVFTAILREIWIGPHDACFHAVENAFTKNRVDVTSRANFQVQSVQAYNQRVIKEYEKIVGTHSRHMENGRMRPPQKAQAIFPAVENSESRPEQPPPPRRIPSNPRPPPLQVDIQAAQQGAYTRNSNGPITQGSLTPGPHTAPLVRARSPSRQSTIMTLHQTSNANNPQTPQSAPLVQFATALQSFQSPGLLNNNIDQTRGQEQRRHHTTPGIVGQPRSLSLGSTEHSAQVGATNRRASHMLPSNAPETFSPGFQNFQQSPTSIQQQQPFPVQMTNIQHHRHAFNTQSPVPRSQHPSSTGSNRFIRFDPFIQPNLPNPDTSALHQVHVKSPVLVPAESHGNPSIVTKYFRFTETVFMPTEAISSKNRHVSWDFTMPRSYIENLVKDRPSSYGAPATRNINSESLLCRIRCIKLSSPDKLPTHSEWVVSDNVWPGSTAVILNGNALEIRKKSHHGKDLPIDITTAVKEGNNSLSTAVIGFQKDSNPSFAIGVEIIRFATEEQIRNNVRTLPSQEARQRIIDRSFQVDPDIEVVFSQLTIDLTDPFTANLFAVPARGASCLHNQCFDLEVFLHSRNLEKPSEPCGPDSFRCPICGADARPQSLVIDGFFVSVRERLDWLGRLDAKAITLHQSGDWEIKEQEEAKGEQGDGTGRRAARTSVGRQSLPKEVIEIDDD